MGQLTEIPDAPVMGMVASRAWADWSAVTHVTAGLLARGAEIRLGGCQAMQDRAMSVALSLLEASDLDVRCRCYGATGPGGNAAERDERFLTDLATADAVLIAFLALDAKGQRGRTHALVDEARERGLAVIEFPAGPDGEPTVSATLAEPIARAEQLLERAEIGFRARYARFALWEVARAAVTQALEGLDDVERRLERQWAWLDAHPLALDYATREHRTLSLLAGCTALMRLRDRWEQLGRDYADVITWSTWTPVAEPGLEVAS